MKKEKKMFYGISTGIYLLTVILLLVVGTCLDEVGIFQLILGELLVIILGMIANALNMALYVKGIEKNENQE